MKPQFSSTDYERITSILQGVYDLKSYGRSGDQKYPQKKYVHRKITHKKNNKLEIRNANHIPHENHRAMS